MTVQAFHQLVNVGYKRLRLAHLNQFGIIRFVCNVAFIIFYINNHRVEVSRIKQINQSVHSRAACTVSGNVNSLDNRSSFNFWTCCDHIRGEWIFQPPLSCISYKRLNRSLRDFDRSMFIVVYRLGVLAGAYC
ncbi:hypothetical protein D1872_272420 [compost metagenome]